MTKVLSILKAVSNFVLHVEPTAVSAAVVAVGAVITGAKAGHLDIGLLVAAVAAVQAVFNRHNVTPTAKVGL